MPGIDLLIITHDHWDHLDYQTVKRLKGRIGKVICPLGVGEHFESWGFGKEDITELDWQENTITSEGLTVHCLPARHFSGRGVTSNQTLWASFLLETLSGNIYLGGDGGYDKHFLKIGEDYPRIDLAILENGQYSENWKHIHTMPQELGSVAKDLKAKRVITVHHSKYALSKHPWDEPLKNESEAAARDSLNLIVPVIGQVIRAGFLNVHTRRNHKRRAFSPPFMIQRPSFPDLQAMPRNQIEPPSYLPLKNFGILIDKIDRRTTPCVTVAVDREKTVRRFEIVFRIVNLPKRIGPFVNHTAPIVDQRGTGLLFEAALNQRLDKIVIGIRRADPAGIGALHDRTQRRAPSLTDSVPESTIQTCER